MKGLAALPSPKSQHSGVTWDRKWSRWNAHAYFGDSAIRLGRFDTEDEAAEAIRLAKLFLAGGGNPEALKSARLKVIRRERQRRKTLAYKARWERQKRRRLKKFKETVGAVERQRYAL